ncbi:hypothetical protein AAV35_012335 [Salimicrobium jeotgali]|uniref:Uncharacterized protein n=1 Tax=Salimicrobium jeotgali TaxID=1230341 RepID=K2H5D2_9BACI|nr:hypothetical protein [Salimicrobium jeotgali]AKG05479.1 hypothetical protein AAV35_012335 [Salimicrobium jeotgali]EKE31055.1 hypothetical protein MJ3_10176 [Salimicrobium jeotgali]MBM7697388.1 hypothetical protein [Salimicrobium jeotgali]
MNEQEWILSQNKDKRVIEPLRAVYYERAQIVEAVQGRSMYYLFFYKEQYVTAVQAKKIKYNSFIGRAFRHGLVCEAPHPLIDHLNISGRFPASTYNSLLQHLSGKYTNQEQAYILTFLESFLPKKKLLQEIKTLFYEVRRQGKMFHSYRIIRLLMDFAPRHRFVKELSHDLQFQKFEEIYDLPAEQLWEKDPLYAEKYLFHNRDESLLSMLPSETPLEITAFRLLLRQEKPIVPGKYEFKLESDFSPGERLRILEHALELSPEDGEVKQLLFSGYLAAQRLNDAFLLTGRQEMALGIRERGMVEDVLLSEKTGLTSLSAWGSFLQEILKHDTKEEIPLLKALIRNTLPHYSPGEIRDILDSRAEAEAEELKEKLSFMEMWEEDLDRMEELGALYYEFDWKEKALECFQYASEMSPEKIGPVQWLAKIYKELGKEKEAASYRELEKQIRKLSL